MLTGVFQAVWSVLGKFYNEFTMESTIHGIKYTYQGKSIIERFLWLMIVILSVLGAGWLAILFYDRHQSANMSTLIMSNEYPSWKMELPAVTLCHGTIALKSKVRMFFEKKSIRLPVGITFDDFENSIEHISQAFSAIHYFPKELEKLHAILKSNDIPLLELLREIGPNCNDFLATCQYEGTTVACDMITRATVTPNGLCCSINYQNEEEEHHQGGIKISMKNHTPYFGTNFILSFLMKSFPSNDSLATIMRADGIKVLIHERYTYPSSTSTGLVVASGFETIVRLYGSYLTCSSEILELKPSVRGCYANSLMEEQVRRDNCYVQCRESLLRKLCNCIPFYAYSVTDEDIICNLTRIPCIANAMVKTHSLKLQYSKCGCLPDCEGTTYNIGISTVPLNAAQFNLNEFYQETLKYPNATVLHVTFAGQSARLQRRELVLSKIHLISSLGGVFSLFLGFSFISIIEMLYFFLISIVNEVKNMKKTKTKIVSSIRS